MLNFLISIPETVGNILVAIMVCISVGASAYLFKIVSEMIYDHLNPED